VFRTELLRTLGSTSKRPNAPKQKTQQVFKSDMTPEEIARARIALKLLLALNLYHFSAGTILIFPLSRIKTACVSDRQKTQQVFKSDMTPEEIARARIKYEEALPWHLEDFDSQRALFRVLPFEHQRLRVQLHPSAGHRSQTFLHL
jgi:hypothetical protein